MKIIVKDENEKKELLKLCQYLHDFSVMFKKMRKRNKVWVVRSFDNSIPDEKITNLKEICGVSLDHNLFPHLQLLVGMHDAEGEIKDEIIKETIILQDHTNKFQS